jgi:F-type H+-transporting ATPase subunit a
VTGPKKRGCLGCSFPVLVIVAVIVVALVIFGFLAGAIGQKMTGLHFPTWLVVPSPDPHLPAPVIFHVLGLPITNGVLAGWITVIFLAVLSWAVTSRMQIVPRRLQAAFEFVLGWIFDVCNSVAGEENGRKFFPVVCTIFLFVLFNAWLSLIPGYGSLELTRYEPIPQNAQIVVVPAEGNQPEHKVVLSNDKEYEIVLVNGKEMMADENELIRGANTEVNTPLALAIVSFVFVAYFGLKALGTGWLKQYFNFGPFFRSIGRIFKGKFSFMDIFSGLIEAFVGGLELLSRFITIISFTFRLFGNMTAGEILLLIAAFLVPWVLAVPFYGLELLIGLVQALIFSLLTLVFVAMAVAPAHGSESSEHEP